MRNQLPPPANWQDFEDLCRDLFAAEWGDSETEKNGRPGQKQQGVDVVGRREGRYWGAQCKLRRIYPESQLKETEVRKDVEAARAFDRDLETLVIATTAPADTRLQELARQLTAENERDGTFRVVIWDWEKIGQGLARHSVCRVWIEKLLPSRPFWNAPYRNRYFSGRVDLLAELERRLQQSTTLALTQAISGLGGVGKTQTAIEYCYRHRSRYDGGVYWVDASNPERLEASYGQLAVKMGLVGDDVPMDKAASAFRDRLASQHGWLVVLDNADQPDAIRQMLPPNTGGHVLLTTRASHPDLGGGEPLEVDVLSREEATEFLLTRSRRDPVERSDAEELALALGCLPLALEQAGAYLVRHDSTDLRMYLSTFKKQRLKVVERQAPLQGKYAATVATTWEISFEQIALASPAAVEALQTCAFLAPDAIPLELFTTTGDRLGPALGELAKQAVDDPTLIGDQLIEPLTRYSMAKYRPGEGGFLSLHRLVQEVLRHGLERDGLASEIFERTHQGLAACFPENSRSPSSWPAAARWFPHIETSLELWRAQPKVPSWDPTSLWMEAGMYAWAAGRSYAARELVEASLEVRRRVLEEEHPDTLTSMVGLAEILRAQGDLLASQSLAEKAIEASRRVLGDNHPITLNSTNNLAESLAAQGNLESAQELLEVTLETCRQVLGDEHPNTLSTMNNLASTRRELGEIESAHILHEEVLKVRRRMLGDDDPATLTSMNNLAASMRDRGDSMGARALQEKAFKICQKMFGDEHPKTLTSMHNLCLLHEESPEMEVDGLLVEDLLAGVRTLGEREPIRVAVEARWLKT